MADIPMRYSFRPREGDTHQRSTPIKQGNMIHWTIPGLTTHLHPAWAGDHAGVPDVSFGATHRVNTVELADAMGYRLVPKIDA